MLKKSRSKSKVKIGLGEKIESEYKYSSRINFKEDLSSQIAKLMQEKKAKDELGNHIEQIRKISAISKKKGKNLNYYKNIGKALSFLGTNNFKNIKPYSVFRRLIDEIPDILPGLDTKRTQDHLMMMYRIGGLDKSIIDKATWNQWYEISKFKNVTDNQRMLNRVLMLCGGATGPDLREEIKAILKK